MWAPADGCRTRPSLVCGSDMGMERHQILLTAGCFIPLSHTTINLAALATPGAAKEKGTRSSSTKHRSQPWTCTQLFPSKTLKCWGNVQSASRAENPSTRGHGAGTTAVCVDRSFVTTAAPTGLMVQWPGRIGRMAGFPKDKRRYRLVLHCKDIIIQPFGLVSVYSRAVCAKWLVMEKLMLLIWPTKSNFKIDQANGTTSILHFGFATEPQLQWKSSLGLGNQPTALPGGWALEWEEVALVRGLYRICGRSPHRPIHYGAQRVAWAGNDVCEKVGQKVVLENFEVCCSHEHWFRVILSCSIVPCLSHSLWDYSVLECSEARGAGRWECRSSPRRWWEWRGGCLWGRRFSRSRAAQRILGALLPAGLFGRCNV